MKPYNFFFFIKSVIIENVSLKNQVRTPKISFAFFFEDHRKTLAQKRKIKNEKIERAKYVKKFDKRNFMVTLKL